MFTDKQQYLKITGDTGSTIKDSKQSWTDDDEDADSYIIREESESYKE